MLRISREDVLVRIKGSSRVRRTLLAKEKIAGVLVILMVGGLAGYLFYHDYAQER